MPGDNRKAAAPYFSVNRTEASIIFPKGRLLMSTDSSKQHGPVIIIADDRRATRHMMRSILAPNGYKLLDAENGREVLDLCSSSLPDLVLMDIHMPDMDGLEACSRLKQLPKGSQVPVLMFTAYDEDKEVEKAFQSGASDFINKPVNPEELRHRVNRLLYLRKLEIQRQEAEAKLQSSYAMISSLLRKVLNAYEEERARLARELHDEVGMALTTLKLNLQLLNNDLSARDDAYKERLASTIPYVDNLLNAIRSKAVFLRPPSLDELGLVAVVDNMVNELSQRTSVLAELQTSSNYEKLPVEIETALYRCIQEALTNVARHASAGHVSVKLEYNTQDVFIRVTDDGIGFDLQDCSDTAKHLGLQGMKERVALLSGEIVINSSPGKGTDIQITIPLDGYGER